MYVANIYAQTYWNLGKFEPPVYATEVVRTELQRFIQQRVGSHGNSFVDVRAPGDSASALELLRRHGDWGGKSVVTNWHADGMSDQKKEPPDHMIMLWTNIVPTELTPAICKFVDGYWELQAHGNPIQSEPGDVIIFSNKAFRHRTPKMFKTVAATRWFARSFFMRPKPVDNSIYQGLGSRDKSLDTYNDFKTFTEERDTTLDRMYQNMLNLNRKDQA